MYQSDVDNELGRISCEVMSDRVVRAEITKSPRSTIIKTNSHICELIEISLRNEWLPKGMSFEESHGWLWKIKRVNTGKEKLNLRCALMPYGEVSSSPDTGENLDAIEIESETKVLHIGTEDPEALYCRAEKSDYMPNRLIKENKINGYALEYTKYLEYGFETEIPELKENEVVYFQYLYAVNTIKLSVEHPDERDISTWFAVEQRKDFLMRELGVKFTANKVN